MIVTRSMPRGVTCMDWMLCHGSILKRVASGAVKLRCGVFFFQVIHDEIAAIKTRVNRTCTFQSQCRQFKVGALQKEQNTVYYCKYLMELVWKL